MKRIILALALLVPAGVLWAAAPPSLSNSVAVCDPNSPTVCFAGSDANFGSSANPIFVTGSSSASGGIAPIVSAAAEASHVLKSSAGNLYAYQVTTGASAGYVLIFDAASAPGDGAVTPKKCVAVQANTTVGATMSPPEAFATGITVVFSTTGCFTKTASATAFISGDVR